MSFSEWKKVQLQDIVSKLGDGLHGTPKYDDDGEFYFINGSNLSDGKIIIKENTPRVTLNEYLKYKKELNDRTILLGINGTIGNVALYNNEKCVLGKSACYFNIINSVDKHFIKYIITDRTFQSYIENFANGTTIKNVSLKSIREFEFFLPSLQTQTRIAQILSSLDDKIELNRQTNQTLEAIAQTLFKEMCLPKGGELEEGWRVGKLKEIIEINPKLTIIKDKTSKYVEMKDLSEDSAIIKRYLERNYSAGSKFQNGDTLLARITPCLENGKTGLVYFLNDNEIGWGSTEFIVLRGKKRFLSYYVYCLSRLSSFRDFAIQSMVGSSGRQRVVDSILAEFELTYPSDEVLGRFHNLVEPFFKQIFSNYKENQTLTTIRDSLLPRLMKGEIDV